MELSRYPRHRMRSFRAGNPLGASASSRSSLLDRATNRVIDLNSAKVNLDKALLDMLPPLEHGTEQQAIGSLALKLLTDEDAPLAPVSTEDEDAPLAPVSGEDRDAPLAPISTEDKAVASQTIAARPPETMQLPAQPAPEIEPFAETVVAASPETSSETSNSSASGLDFLAGEILSAAVKPASPTQPTIKPAAPAPSSDDYLNGLLALDATISGLAQSLRSAQAPAKPHVSEPRTKHTPTAPTNPANRHAHSELSRSRVYIVKRRARSVKRPPRIGIKPPTTQPLSNGRRVEMYEHGASVVKDALGRVVEVRSHIGHQLFLNYTPQGNLQSFCRLDAYGNLHSVAEQDKQGLVVRGPNGEVQAAGEYMSAGPAGCLTIHRFDGQFWSIDLVLGTYTERRLIRDRSNRTHCLTAIFAYDGFRMMTRFQTLPAEGGAGAQGAPSAVYSRDSKWQPVNTKAVLRFYGRDGSMIEFDSDENLEALKPKRIALLKGRNIGRHGQAKGQARTAWDAVERYLGYDANRV